MPPVFTETEVANNPHVYTEDPGSFCQPFKNPERVLGERSFFVIFRAEQPVISAEASVKKDPLGRAHERRVSADPCHGGAEPGGDPAPRTRGGP